jgi:transcriptional regulator with XRE-family HTH domain
MPEGTSQEAPRRQDGKKIRALRHKAGLSQDALAKLARMRQVTVSSIETEKTNAHMGTLHGIAAVLGVPVRELERAEPDGTAA